MIDRTWDYGLESGAAFEPEVDDEVPFDRSLPHVMTALGPIDPDELGVTLPHEHIFARPPGADPDLVLDDPHRALSELESYYLAGGRTIVDMSTVDYGRDAAAIAWIAARSPVNLVAATGHQQDRFAAPFLGDSSAEEIAAQSVRELTSGIDETGVKAGVITAGASFGGITPVEERVLQAAAWAQLETGAPISAQAEVGSMALEQLAILREEGAEAGRIIIGHLDHRRDDTFLRQILETGAYVSVDHISHPPDGRDQGRAAMVKRLIDAGYADRIVLSGDLARRSMRPAYGGTPGWTYLIEGFPLLLMEAGVGAEEVRRLVVENPARALTVRRPSRHIP